MASITIQLSKDRLERLETLAAKFNLRVQDLVRVTVEELLDHPDEEMIRAREHVIQKNRELYRRLS